MECDNLYGCDEIAVGKEGEESGMGSGDLVTSRICIMYTTNVNLKGPKN